MNHFMPQTKSRVIAKIQRTMRRGDMGVTLIYPPILVRNKQKKKDGRIGQRERR